MKLRNLLIYMAVLTSIPAMGQTTQKLTANKLSEYGLIYSLPLTGINVTVEVECIQKTPGQFYQYAKKYLGEQPITESSKVYTLKSVVVTPTAVADDEESYLVQFKSGSTPFMMLDGGNFPLSINTEAVSIPQQTQLPVAKAAEPSILDMPIARQAVTEEMMQSPSSAKRAELAAARIFELRASRADIIAGRADQMPSDGTAMQLALDNLGAQEAALTAMFLGTTQTSTEVRTYNYLPDGSDSQELIVARISSLKGAVDATDLSGAPLYMRLTATEHGQLPVNEKGKEKEFPKGGLAYCIPGSGVVSLSFNGNEVASQKLDIAQFGVVFGLDPNLFTDKKEPAYAIFNPFTGAIREIGTVK